MESVGCRGAACRAPYPTMTPSPSPEERLLVLAARIDQAPETRTETALLLRQSPDWSLILKRAKELGVQPLLCKHLSQKQYARHLPSEALASLKQSYRSQSIKNIMLYGTLDRILESVTRDGPPLVLLKGAFLAKWLYGDIALRPMNDIDLMCREEDLCLIGDRLMALGFTQRIYKSPVHESLRKHPPWFFHPRMGKVDLHLNIFFPASHGPDDVEKVWKAATPLELDGHRLKCLAPEDQLLHLLIHLSHHMERGSIALYWLCDIHEVVRHYGPRIDWPLFSAKARSLGMEDRTGPLLNLLEALWKTPVPQDILSGMEGDHDGLDFIGLIRGQGDTALWKRRALENYAGTLKKMKEIKGSRDRLYYLARQIFPRREYLIQRYDIDSEFLVYPYYAYRLLKICKRAAESVFHNMASIFKNEK